MLKRNLVCLTLYLKMHKRVTYYCIDLFLTQSLAQVRRSRFCRAGGEGEVGGGGGVNGEADRNVTLTSKSQSVSLIMWALQVGSKSSYE